MKVMIPTQAKGNCVVVRRGGKEAGGVIRGLRNTNRMRGEAVWASQRDVVKLWSSRDRRANAAGVRRRLSFLSGEISAGVLGCPSIAIVGWQGTVAAVRLLLAAEKSAEAVVPAGSKIAGKGRTRSRASGRLGSRPSQ